MSFSSIRNLALVTFSVLLTGCAAMPQQNQSTTTLQHAYDYQLLSPQQQKLTLNELIQKLAEADVVFIGEYHGNHASHLLQAQVLSGLYQQNQTLLLSLEMFNRDQQGILDDYIDGQIGENYLIKEAPAWDNYAASYRPLVEFAKQNYLPVIAANASADIVRCIGRQGESYLNKLNQQERGFIAQQPFAEIPGYQAKYFEFLERVRKLSATRKQQSYLAQITRDNTMAESIYQAWLNNPKQQIIHINGSFHSADHLGTVAALKELQPDLKIQVISPIYQTDLTADKLGEDDFYYLVQAQPEQYVDASYKRKERQAMFKKSAEKRCK